MATISRAVQTSQPVSLGGSIPGDAATGHLLRDRRKFMENLAPQNTPILNLIQKNKGAGRTSGEGPQAKIEWGMGANLPHTAEVEGALGSGATTIAVVAGQGARFQKYQKLALYDLDVNGNADWSTKEEVWVSAEPSTDNLTVVRGRGTTSTRAFLDGALIEIIGVAYPEGQDFTVGPDVTGDWSYNYFQGFETMAHVTEEGDQTPNAEFSGSHMARQMRQKAMRMKLLLEKTLIQGSRNAGTLATPTPSELGGILSFIPSANTTNLGGNLISVYDIDSEGRELWDSVGDARAKKLLMNMDTASMFDGQMNKYRQASMTDTTADLTFDSINLRTGRYEIVPTRWIPDGMIAGVNLDNVSLVPYGNMSWKEKELSTDGAYRKRAIYGRYSLIVEAPETFFLITGFDTNLANYGRTF